MAYLQIYKNRINTPYTHTVLKGNEMYGVNISSGEKMRWEYLGKINRDSYVVNGSIISKPSLKMISILQRTLQPKNESIFNSFKNWINEKFTLESDPIKDMGIGDRSIYGLNVRKYYYKNIPGFYLLHNSTTFIMYNPDSDKYLKKYIINKLGEWNIEIADEWSDYVVIEIFKDGGEEGYHW